MTRRLVRRIPGSIHLLALCAVFIGLAGFAVSDVQATGGEGDKAAQAGQQDDKKVVDVATLKTILKAELGNFRKDLIKDFPILTAGANPPPPPGNKQKKPPVKHPRGLKNPSQQVLNLRHQLAKALHGGKMLALAKATPASFDARSQGWVCGVLNQQQCGSCWDFSGTEMVTSAYIKAGLQPATFQLSEQYSLDCWTNGGCDGDDNVHVLEWAKDHDGLPSMTDYPDYTGSVQQCRLNPGTKMYKINAWGYCTPAQQAGQAGTQDIKVALMAYGVIGSAVVAGPDWDAYQNGVLTGVGGETNHDIIIIGWDDSKGDSGAWLVQNSWGTDWGLNGTCWVAYGALQIGTEAVWCTATSAQPSTPAKTYTITGPASGTVGQASTFTLTPNGTFTGTITPSDSGAGGTFTPAVVSWSGTTAPSVLTFTYTPMSAGNFSFTGTNSGGLTDPGAFSFQATTGPGPSPCPTPVVVPNYNPIIQTRTGCWMRTRWAFPR